MDLTNDFRVALPVERAWAILTDLELIAPCMPGAQLQEVEGDTYRGIVKVKVGPVVAQYKGEASFVERDETAHVASIRAEGRETRGQGSASATITATLTPDGDGTAVSLVTDLAITGRVAQFGRGVLADVSAALLDQFVESLESTVLADESGGDADAGSDADASGGDAEADPGVDATRDAAAEDSAPAPAPAVRRIDSPEPTPVDLVGAAGSPVLKRVGALVAVVLVVLVIRRMRSRRR